jgi:hypothetical protein
MKFIWPIDSPVITRNFFFTDPLYLGGQHAAVDIICSSMPTYGAPVVAVAAGVLYASPINDRLSGWNVYIDHDGGWRSGYRHFREQIFQVGVPIPVAQGQVIGYADSTGTVTGPHLHFDLWNHEKKDSTAFYKVGWYAHNPEKYLTEEVDMPFTEAELRRMIAEEVMIVMQGVITRTGQDRDPALFDIMTEVQATKAQVNDIHFRAGAEGNPTLKDIMVEVQKGDD